MRLRPSLPQILLPFVAALVSATIAGWIAYRLGLWDLNTHASRHSWRPGMSDPWAWATMAGAFAGFLGARRALRGRILPLRSWTVGYRAGTTRTYGYRDAAPISIADLVAALNQLGYAPRVRACDETGIPHGDADVTAPLAGANVEITDKRVTGSVRVHLATDIGAQRRMGVVDVRGKEGSAGEEMGSFTLRALDRLFGGIDAAPAESTLSAEPVHQLLVALPEMPQRR